LLVRCLEAKDFITDIDLVAGLQNSALHPLPVDERAVGAAQVVEHECRAFTSNVAWWRDARGLAITTRLSAARPMMSGWSPRAKVRPVRGREFRKGVEAWQTLLVGL